MSTVQLIETFTQIFGNAPHLFLSIISRYQVSGSVAGMSPRDMSSSHTLEKNDDGEPHPEPPAAPPVIILSENSSLGGSAPQPQAQDPVSTPHSATSSLTHSPRLDPQSPHEQSSITSHSKPKPQPEPHPAPPVIILSLNKRPASSSPPTSPPTSPHLEPTRPSAATGPTTRKRQLITLKSQDPDTIMGSKTSKLAPKNGKLQSSQEKKDKEEMKEPTNYYTHRSKSMRRKAGKEGGHGGAGGVSMGSGGAGGAI
ncbi:hypothetical protein E8E13_009216 [Curvularia kusanoi]|uniref:Uncharacterized protein n=1 Tax=Curvularia kusanoi TaxID=90978 RepID=A0A9P4TFU0_CURKU|nr:hypothetical protein E8E13_009216 [Curvularia kusanoi]